MKKEIVDILNSILGYDCKYTDSPVYRIWCDNVLISTYHSKIIIKPYDKIIHYDEFSDIEVIIFEIGKYCSTIFQHLRNEKLKQILL